jgi:hypothetical protein
VAPLRFNLLHYETVITNLERQAEILKQSTIRNWRHNIQHNDPQHNDTQHNDTQHNDIQHNGLICDTQRNDIQLNGLICETKYK